jgi:YidC/Oxa1 family membrane protein insertase
MFGVLAQLLAWCFSLVPNYAVAITLFTVIVMLAVTPFTIKGMRSAAEMSRIQPEVKKLQDQYKNDRVKQNEEMQKLFKEHGVNPLGGCLPTLLPLPIFFIIFRLLRGLNGRHNGVFAPLVRVLRQQVGTPGGYVAPHYLSYKTSLTQHIMASNGVMKSFGMDLAATARQHHATVGQALPYYGLIVVMTASQYWQQREINKRNPAAANANPQMKLTMQIFPAFYALISLSIPASVVFYLFVSGLYRMAQNALSYRFDPVMRAASAPAVIEASSRPSGKPDRPSSGRQAAAVEAPARKGLFASLREAADQARAQQQNGGGAAGNGASRSSRGTQKSSRELPASSREARESKKPSSSEPDSTSSDRSTDAPAERYTDQFTGTPSDASADASDAPADDRFADADEGSDRSADADAAPGQSDAPPRSPSTGSPLSVRPSGRATPPGSFGGRKRSKRRS